MLFMNKENMINKYIRAAADCAEKVGDKGIVSAADKPDTFFLYVIGVMRSYAAESIAGRFPEYSQLPEIFSIGNSSDTKVPDMLLDELKHLIRLSADKKLKNDPDLICLLICYLAYFNSIAENAECMKMEKNLFRKIELSRMIFSGHCELMYSSALWFSDKYGFREKFLGFIKAERNDK